MTLESVYTCPVCQSERIAEFLQCKDHFVSRETFEIRRCNDCGFCFTSPRPHLDDIGPYYESEAYVSHSKTQSGFVNRMFHLARNFTIGQKRRLVAKYSGGQNLLDYGCGTGEFLYDMAKHSYHCTGVEPNESARRLASRNSSVRVIDETGLESFPEGSFDTITLWHVLEHIYPLDERIDAFKKLLVKKGTLFVALPNMDSFDARIYERFWAAWDVPRHVYHFNPETIDRLMATHGFERIDTRPMVLDAFYISLLSEKYRRGRSNFPLAFYNGLRSNLKAYFGNGSYSSLIYIFKKSN